MPTTEYQGSTVQRTIGTNHTIRNAISTPTTGTIITQSVSSAGTFEFGFAMTSPGIAGSYPLSGYSMQVDVTSIGSSLSLGSSQVAGSAAVTRYTSDLLTWVGSLGTGAGQTDWAWSSTTGVGLKSATSNSAVGFGGSTATDRPVFHFRATNGNMMSAESISFRVNTANSYLTGPWAHPNTPNPPTNLTATGDSDSISLAWTAPASGNAPTSYKVRRLNGQADTLIITTASSSGLGASVVQAQSFLAPSAAINGVRLDLYEQSTGDRDLLVAIRSTRTGPVLSSAIVPRASIPTGAAPVDVPLPGISTTPGVSYWVTAQDTGGSTGTVYVYRNISNPYAGGSYWQADTEIPGSDMVITINPTPGLSYSEFSVAAPTTTYDDTTALPDTTYNYTVRSAFSGLESTDSNSATGSITSAPAVAPGQTTGLTVTGTTHNSVGLSWTAPTTGTAPFEYAVERTDNGSITPIFTNETTLTDTGLSASRTYSYVVSAANDAGVGPDSNSVNATTTAAPVLPGAITGLIVSSRTDTSVTLSWDVATGTQPMTYEIWDTFDLLDTTSNTTWTENNRTPSSTRTYFVNAVNAAGAGPASTIDGTTSGPQILVPTGDGVIVGAWTTNTGATTNLYTAIDEISPGAVGDYVQSPAGAGTTDLYRCTFTNALVPVSRTGHKFIVRHGKDATGGSTVDLTVSLRQGEGTVIAERTFTAAEMEVTDRTDTITLTEAQANLITDYTDLRMEFDPTFGGGQKRSYRVYWAQVELPSAAPIPDPPTNVTAITDADSINVSWNAPLTGEPPVSYSVYRVQPNMLTGDNATFTNTNGTWSIGQSNTALSNVSGALRFTTSADTVSTRTVKSPGFSVVSGTRITAGGDIRVVSGVRPASIDVQFLSETGEHLSSLPSQEVTSTTFTNIRFNTVAPSGAFYVNIRFGTDGTGATGDMVEIDNAFISKVDFAAQVAAPATTWDDTTALPNTTYSYQVRSHTSVTQSVYSTSAQATTGPLTLSATPDADSINLSWNQPTGTLPTSYNLYTTVEGVAPLLTGEASTFDNNGGGWTGEAGASAVWDVGVLAVSFGTEAGVRSDLLPVTANSVVPLSIEIKSTGATPGTAFLEAQWYAADGTTLLSNSVVDSLVPSTSMLKMSGIAVSPASTAYMRMRVSALNSSDVILDNALAGGTGTGVTSISAPATSYDDTSAVEGVPYTYTIRPVVGGMEGGDSNSVIASFGEGPPPPTTATITEITALDGSSEPTYRTSQHHVARTNGGRMLVVSGWHGTGVMLSWSDDEGATWSRTTRGDALDGGIVRGLGTGDVPASIAVVGDYAYVIWGRNSSTLDVNFRRLSDIDGAGGPIIGVANLLTSTGRLPDVCVERASNGQDRVVLAWWNDNAAVYSNQSAYITDLTSETPALTQTQIVSASGLGRYGSLISRGSGLGFVHRGASGNLRLHFKPNTAAPTDAWTEAAAAGPVVVTATPNGVFASSKWVAAIDTNTTVGSQACIVQSWSEDGTTTTTELTMNGYENPTLTTDGTVVFVVAHRISDDSVISRRRESDGTWGPDFVEMPTTNGGTHNYPNVMPTIPDGELRFVTEALTDFTPQSQVLYGTRTAIEISPPPIATFPWLGTGIRPWYGLGDDVLL